MRYECLHELVQLTYTTMALPAGTYSGKIDEMARQAIMSSLLFVGCVKECTNQMTCTDARSGQGSSTWTRSQLILDTPHARRWGDVPR